MKLVTDGGLLIAMCWLCEKRARVMEQIRHCCRITTTKVSHGQAQKPESATAGPYRAIVEEGSKASSKVYSHQIQKARFQSRRGLIDSSRLCLRGNADLQILRVDELRQRLSETWHTFCSRSSVLTVRYLVILNFLGGTISI